MPSPQIRRAAAVGVLSAALVLGGATTAQAKKKQTHFVYRVASVTHASTTTGQAPNAVAHSSASWKLAKPTRKATNRIAVDYTPVGVIGGGMFNLRGVYRADATVQNGPRTYHCELTAPTGSTTYPLAAPDADMLAVAGGRKGLTVTFGTIGGGSRIATAPSGGGYFESGCGYAWHFTSNQVSRARALEHIAYSTFRRKRIVLRFKGGFGSQDTTSQWNTKFVLKRVDKPAKKRKKAAKKHKKTAAKAKKR